MSEETAPTPPADPDQPILDWLSVILLNHMVHVKHRVTAAQILLSYYKRWKVGASTKWSAEIGIVNGVLKEMVAEQTTDVDVDLRLEGRLIAAATVLS